MRNGEKNRTAITIFVIVLACGLIPVKRALAEPEIGFQGEVTGWAAFEDNSQSRGEMGFRYLPELNLSMHLSDELMLDGQATANLYGTYQKTEGTAAEADHVEKIHRFWARIYTDQAGIRLGRQEISFGPGKILRSLKWFDQKDSRDPTGFTDGVDALLFRYYFEDNANLWIWSMTGNDEPPGISILNTADNTWETGGRVQIPVGSAELGLSVHQRQVDRISSLVPLTKQLQENRIGFDLAWDLGVGLYLETSYLQLEKNPLIPENQLFLTLGCDYTFDIADGLSSIVEVMGVDLQSDSNDSVNGTLWLAAVSEQISLNLLDQLQIMVFRNFESGITTLQTSWQRTTDDWILNLMLYTSHTDSDSEIETTDRYSFYNTTGQNGIRLLFQINH